MLNYDRQKVRIAESNLADTDHEVDIFPVFFLRNVTSFCGKSLEQY